MIYFWTIIVRYCIDLLTSFHAIFKIVTPLLLWWPRKYFLSVHYILDWTLMFDVHFGIINSPNIGKEKPESMSMCIRIFGTKTRFTPGYSSHWRSWSCDECQLGLSSNIFFFYSMQCFHKNCLFNNNIENIVPRHIHDFSNIPTII